MCGCRQKNFTEAKECFSQALSLTIACNEDEEQLLLKLMLNVAMCLLKLDQWENAALWSAAGAAVLPDPPKTLGAKAWYRLGEAMTVLDEESCAEAAFREAAKLNDGLAVPEMQRKRKGGAKGTKAVPVRSNQQLLFQVSTLISCLAHNKLVTY
jgi:tetratricopeptide (TPR) repeat protein